METIDVAGRTRSYTLITPPTQAYDQVLLVFHGSTQNAESFRKFTSNAFDRFDNTAVVYLDGFQGNWNDARKHSRFPARTHDIDDVAFAEAVVKRVADGRQTYAAGYSNGGGMVIRLLHERPDLITGAAVIAAQQPAPDNFLIPDLPVTPKPLVLFHGTKDRIVPYHGGRMAAWARLAFRVDGAMLSAPQTAAYFAERNGITAPPVTTADRTDYRQDGRASVTLYTLPGGGHTIPGPQPSPRLMGRTATDVHAVPAIKEFLSLS